MRILKSSYVHKAPYRYHMQPELYSALTQDKVIREAALRSGVSQGVIQELKDTAIQITWYDRNGDIVHRVTSTSGDVVTEPDVDSTDDNEINGSSQNGSGGNGGSSGNTGTGTVTPSSGEGATRANQRGGWHTNDVSPHTYQLFYRFTFLLIVILVCQIDNNLCTTLSGIRKFCEYDRICPFLHYPYVPKRNMCIFCTSWLPAKFFHFIEILLLNSQVFLFRNREQQKVPLDWLMKRSFLTKRDKNMC